MLLPEADGPCIKWWVISAYFVHASGTCLAVVVGSLFYDTTTGGRGELFQTSEDQQTHPLLCEPQIKWALVVGHLNVVLLVKVILSIY